jgi:hypothetical protein
MQEWSRHYKNMDGGKGAGCFRAGCYMSNEFVGLLVTRTTSPGKGQRTVDREMCVGVGAVDVGEQSPILAIVHSDRPM